MSSSKTLTPPLGADEEYEEAHPKMDRPTGQLFELQELQKLQLKSFSPESERADQQVPPPPGPPPGAPPPPVPQGGERGLREFNYNGRDVKPRNSERSSGVLGRRRVSSYSIYSNYSSYASSDDGRRDAGLGGVNVGGASGEGRAVPQVEHVERPPERNPDMRAVPQPLRTASSPGRRRGGSRGGPVQPPPPTYQDPYSRDAYSRVRFADPERREDSRGPAPRHIEMANITGGHSVSTLWVFACCAFFWYRCLMDEDF
ncbi:hypothetical protein CMUS01_01621 [Colletotrichum musicola]|uniref:Uncharacterized protein n=1 Tax=Colletotrichum musicola TaxID=2175873 RepID=A0A8H6NWL3_9PEZI|nr:hypothetical protein CMUS01_01621 [Colletotrichum musicola]